MSLAESRASKGERMEDESSTEISARRLVYFAAERTLMAWVRTALGMMALGFLIDRFGLVLRQTMPEASARLLPKFFSLWVGAVLVVVGVAMAAVASVRYLRFEISYHREGTTQPHHGILAGVLFSVILVVLGTVVVVFLITVTD
jgi:putative membrane protein